MNSQCNLSHRTKTKKEWKRTTVWWWCR